MARPSRSNRRVEVAIFGAGIAGLTAAHELIERGFRVEVFEETAPSPMDADTPCGIGGIARTQWSRAERPDRRGSRRMRRIQSTEPVPTWPPNARRIAFKPSTNGEPNCALDKDAEAPIREIADFLSRNPRIRSVEIRGFCSERLAPYPEHPDVDKRPDYRRALAVRTSLVETLKNKKSGLNWEKRLIASALGLGLRDDWTCEDSERDFVDFRIIEDLIPGEHGFRFFPAFYRNLFDTMSRTPVPEDRPVFIETTRTVLDNVVQTRVQRVSFAHPTPRSFDFPRQPVESVQGMFDLLSQSMRAIGCTLGDIVRFHAKLLKYMTTCPERRQAEYEGVSWFDFVEGERYSANFKKYIDITGQMLVSMTARQSDARSFGTVTVQLLQDQFMRRPHVDGTLNGPTSLAWFDPWRLYLERQGVEFHRAKLVGFEVQSDRVWPVVRFYNPAGKLRSTKTVLVRDYYVLALGTQATRVLLDQCPQLDDEDFARLRQLPFGDVSEARPRGTLQHMSGIQYYFDTDAHLVEGHIDYPDSEWGLSSVSQPQFWTRRRGWWSGYRGVLSVDICDWFSKSSFLKKAAWECTKDEIAQEVWRQITDTISDPKQVPDPILYHLDENIIVGENGVRANNYPYLVNRTGEFDQRPGKPGKYQVHHRVVMAGNFMQTYTRMSTMESANESARHAVNAILDEIQFDGERCRVWNPEDNEPPEFKYWVELDRKLFARGQPHFMDTLGMSQLPQGLRSASDPKTKASNILRL